MTIGKQSRYINATISTVVDERGPHQSINQPLDSERSYQFTFYMIKEFDDIDKIASSVYGDGKLWWAISDANPEIMDWTTIKVGTTIRVPNV